MVGSQQSGIQCLQRRARRSSYFRSARSYRRRMTRSRRRFCGLALRPPDPLRLQLRRGCEGLEYDAVLLGLFVQGFELLGGGFGGVYFEDETYGLEADRGVLGDA